jgi:hypothetical protein
MAPTLYRVYVDETGDRGWGGRASPIFVVSAVIVRDGKQADLIGALDRINTDLKKPPGTVLHWAENVKAHPQRKHVAKCLAAIDMTIASVVVIKQPMMGSGTGLSDSTSMYNYAIRRLLERVSWFVDDHGGQASITFAHIKRFPYEQLRAYIELLRQLSTTIRWRAFLGNPKIDQPARIRQLQVADLVAGAHGSALRQDDYGDFEASYLHQLVPLIYIRGRARATSYGFNVIGPDGCMDTYPWWAPFVAKCDARTGRQ